MSTRKGFTLIELLVVIVIIGILVSLTMPALNAARAAARKIQCTNNLKQFGLAFANFEAHNGGYPPTRSSNKRSTWSLAMLDYLELTQISAQYDDSKTFTQGENNQLLMRKRVPLFQCPATPLPDRTQYLSADNASTKVADATGLSSDGYAVGTCVDYFTHHKGFTGPDIVGGGTSKSYSNPLAGFESITPITDITDGLSNTIVLDEMAGRPNRWARGKRDSTHVSSATGKAGEVSNQPYWASWGGCTSQQLRFWDESGQVSFQTTATKENLVGVINATNDGVYSFHPAGANALFLDGSVKFLSEMIIADVFCFLSAKDSGLPFTLSDAEVRSFASLYPQGDPTSLGR